MLDGFMFPNFDDIKAFAFAVLITFFTLMKGLHFLYGIMIMTWNIEP